MPLQLILIIQTLFSQENPEEKVLDTKMLYRDISSQCYAI